MANPKSATVMGIGAPANLEVGKLTPEQAEMLASTFVPSWEMDQWPVSPDATLTNAQMKAIELTSNDVAADAPAANGVERITHAPPPRVHVTEPEDSIIIDRSITADALAASAPPAPPPPAAAIAIAPPPPPPPPVVHSPASTRMAVPAQSADPPKALFTPPRAPSTSAYDDELPIARSSKKGLFIGIGAAALVVVIGVAAISMSSSDKPQEPAAAAAPAQTTAATNAKAIPPPPPVTAAPTAAPTAVGTGASAAETATATAAPTAPPKPEPAAAAPRARPANEGVAPTPPPAPKPPPVAHPAPRPAPAKPGGNIVRDVPF